MKKIQLIVLILLVAKACNGQEFKNEYRVEISKGNLREITIQAEINISSPRLTMDWPAANSVENGWAHFVKDLRVYDSQNRPIEFTRVKKATWSLKTKESRVKFSYKINLNHDKVNWTEGGHSASAYVVDNTAYAIGAALFISDSADLSSVESGNPATVHFELPEGFKVVTPWKLKSNSDDHFEVNSTYELVRTGMLIGNLSEKEIDIEGMKVQIATAPDFESVIPIFSSIYEEIVPAVQGYFGDKKEEKYVAIANSAPRTEEFSPYFSGEALHQSMSIISPSVPTPDYLPVFLYLLSHEYIHIWNGINIRAADQNSETWFMEGFTDYIGWGLLYKLEKFPPNIFINGLSVAGNSAGWGENIKKYLKAAGSISMREAGKAKQDNYDLIYSGGSLFALILDIEMNSRTNGQNGVQELMRELNSKYGNSSSKGFSYGDLKKTTSELCGTSMDEIFDNYVNGSAIIPVAEYLGKVGLLISNIGGENQQITIDQSAGDTEKQLLKVIFESN